MDDRLEERVRTFRRSLAWDPVPTIVRKHLTFGDVFALDHDKYFELKTEVSDHFNIHPSEVIIVGSAKMGFSIAPNKRFRPFGDESDIDIAIISNSLFDNIWEQVFDYWNDVGIWYEGEDFQKYLFRGWIRPDKLPPSNRFDTRKDWWEFFRLITQRQNYGPYKISAGLYKSWHFFESYQAICIRSCKQDAELTK